MLLHVFGCEIHRIHPTFHDRSYLLNRGTDWRDDLSRIMSFENCKTVVDVGANVGQSSIEFFNLFRQAEIFAFEPDPDTFTLLEKSTNKLSRVSCYNTGIGESNGTLSFIRHKDSVLSSFVEHGDGLLPHHTNIQTTIEVAVRRLDNEDCLSDGIDFLKTDTQGFDLQVLKGAQLLFEERKIGAVLIELNFDEIYKSNHTYADICNFLHAHSFDLIGFYGLAISDSRNRLSWGDALFVRRELMLIDNE